MFGEIIGNKFQCGSGELLYLLAPLGLLKFVICVLEGHVFHIKTSKQ